MFVEGGGLDWTEACGLWGGGVSGSVVTGLLCQACRRAKHPSVVGFNGKTAAADTLVGRLLTSHWGGGQILLSVDVMWLDDGKGFLFVNGYTIDN